MSDFRGEFTSLKLEERLKELGICVQCSVPHIPQQNGWAECFNWTLFEKAEAMHHQVCLPKSWWEFCIEYAIHVYNRTPIICLKHKTPMRLLIGLNLMFLIWEFWAVEPMSSYMKMFGKTCCCCMLSSWPLLGSWVVWRVGNSCRIPTPSSMPQRLCSVRTCIHDALMDLV